MPESVLHTLERLLKEAAPESIARAGSTDDGSLLLLCRDEPTRALIVTLCNHVDDLVAAVEALRDLADEAGKHRGDVWCADFDRALEDARAAVAPFVASSEATQPKETR